MTERTLNICDLCNDRVAKTTCSICGKDACNYCSKEWRISLSPNNNIHIIFCKNCLNNKFSKGDLDIITKNIIEMLKKAKIIQGLE